jgi:hypothetical protein
MELYRGRGFHSEPSNIFYPGTPGISIKSHSSLINFIELDDGKNLTGNPHQI